MAATFVKVTELKNNGVTGGTTDVVSGAVSSTAGNALLAVAGVYYDASTNHSPTLVASGGGTWTTHTPAADHHYTGNDNLAMGFASCPSATGGSQTLTFTWTLNTTSASHIGTVWVYEFSGMPSSGLLDVIGTAANGAASPVTVTSLTNVNANDVMLAGGFTMSSSTETHGSPANSWTMPAGGDEGNPTFLTGVSAYKIVSAAAAQSTSWTLSPTGSSWISHGVALKAGAGATQFPISRSVTVTTTATVTRAATLPRTVTASQATAASVVATPHVTVPITRSATQTTSVSIASAPKINYPISRTVGVTTVSTLARVQSLKRTLTATQATSSTVAIRRDVKNTATVTTSVATAVLLNTSGVALPTDYYSTTFPLAENPLNEGGIWTLGGVTGVDWTDPRTVTNRVFGVQTGATAVFPSYKDSIAAIKGTWGADQEVTATVFSSVGNGGYYTEVELLLRFTITPRVVTGYEITLNVNPVNSYIQVNRWNGVVNGGASNYTEIGAGAFGVIANGDIVKASIIGSTIRVFVNGTQVYTTTDSTYATGRPGIGFFNNDNPDHADPSTFGFTRVTLHTVGAPIPLSRSISVGTSVRLARASSATRTVTQAQSVTLRQQGFLRRLLSVAQALTISRGSTQAQYTVNAVAQLVVSLQVRQVKLLDLVAPVALVATLVRRFGLQRTVQQPQALSRIRRVSQTRTIVKATSATLTSSGTTASFAITGFCAVDTNAVGFISEAPPTPIPPEPSRGIPSLVPSGKGHAPDLGPAAGYGPPPLLPFRQN